MISCKWMRRQFTAAAALTPGVTLLNANRVDFPLQHLPSPHTLASLTCGRDGWVRTNESGSQSPMPYRLATPLYRWALICRLKYPRPFYPISCQQNGRSPEGGERPGSNLQPTCTAGIEYLRYLAIVGSRTRGADDQVPRFWVLILHPQLQHRGLRGLLQDFASPKRLFR